MKEWKFDLRAKVCLVQSGEEGIVIGRAESIGHVDQYHLRYTASDGRLVEGWWDEGAIQRF